MYVKRNDDGKIILPLVKLTDDILIAGGSDGVQEFMTQISKRFEKRYRVLGSQITFNGCTIKKFETHSNFEWVNTPHRFSPPLSERVENRNGITLPLFSGLLLSGAFLANLFGWEVEDYPNKWFSVL